MRVTPEELLRLAAHGLRPEAVRALRDCHGMAHEWESDFHDFGTDEAMQPLELRGEAPDGP